MQNITKKQEKRKRKIKKFQKTSNEQGSLSLTQILSVVSIVVSLVGLYYKRKELMSFVKPERRGARTIEISEANLERLREAKQKAEECLEE